MIYHPVLQDGLEFVRPALLSGFESTHSMSLLSKQPQLRGGISKPSTLSYAPHSSGRESSQHLASLPVEERTANSPRRKKQVTTLVEWYQFPTKGKHVPH